MSGRINATTAYATKTATVTNAAKLISDATFGWAASDLANAEIATISARSAGVMALWSGVVPTASLGHLIATNGTYVIQGNSNILALQFIREAGVDSTLVISLEKYAG